MKKIFILFIFASLLCFGGSSYVKANGIFRDTPSAMVKHEASLLFDMGVIKGDWLGRLKPNEPLTKEEWQHWLKRYIVYRSDHGDLLYSPKPTGSSKEESLTFEMVANDLQSVLLAGDQSAFGKQGFLAAEQPQKWVMESLRLSGYEKEIGQQPSVQDGIHLLRHLDALLGHYDVAVYGSELESVSASVMAAKKGLQVALFYEKPKVGGLLVDGKLNYIDVPQSDDMWLMQGFAKEFYDAVGNSFDFERARGWMNQQLDTHLIDCRHIDGTNFQLDLEGGKIKAIKIGEQKFSADMFIDASENGDLMAVSGAKYSKGLEDIGRSTYPGTTLIYELKNVDYGKIADFLRNRAKTQQTFEGATEQAAWGFGDEMSRYTPKNPDILVRAINMAYVKETGHLVCNHVVNVNIDPLDEQSIIQAKKELKDEIDYLITYLKKNVVGFEKASLAEYAKELYLRDSRHFIGSYVLKVGDVVNRKEFHDSVLITNYPIDVHATNDHKQNMILYYPQSYNIPFRCLHDDVHQNLLVSSKCASYQSLAAGSSRIVMTGTMMSEIAARSAAQAIFDKKSVQEVNVVALKDELMQAGFLQNHPQSLKKKVPDSIVKQMETGKIDNKTVEQALVQ